MEKKYTITEDSCREMIKGKVCPSCGKDVEPLETVDNSNHPTFWAGCKDCDAFSWGVAPHVFAVAKKIVDDHNYIAYSYLGVKSNHPEAEWPEWYRSQYSGACSNVQTVLKVSANLTNQSSKINYE